MFGLGASEIVIIMAIALIVFGPQKLPELAKQMARMVGDLRRAADDVKQNFEEATREPPPPPPSPAAVQALLAASQQQQHRPNHPSHPPAGYEVAANPAQTARDAVAAPQAPEATPAAQAKPATDIKPVTVPSAAPADTVAEKAPDVPVTPPGHEPPPSSGSGHG